MIIRVELHSAITGQITEIERAGIADIGRGETLGNYATETLRGPCPEDLNKRVVHRNSFVEHRRKAQHVWHLVLKALGNEMDDIAAELRQGKRWVLADARDAWVPKSQVQDNGD